MTAADDLDFTKLRGSDINGLVNAVNSVLGMA